jgi:hypothetical protein
MSVRLAAWAVPVEDPPAAMASVWTDTHGQETNTSSRTPRINNGSTRRRRQLEEPSAIETRLDSKAAGAGSGIDATQR